MSVSGKNNPNYKDGRSIKQHYCLACEKKINCQAIKCRSCANKDKKHSLKTKQKLSKMWIGRRGGKDNPNWKGGRDILKLLYRCIDCNKIISLDAKRCRNCSGKIQSKRQEGRKKTRIAIKKQSISLKRAWKNNPNMKNALIQLNRNPEDTKYRQKDMYSVIKKYFKSVKWEYTVKTKKSYRILDCAILKLKLDFEYNGMGHLKNKVRIDDKRRTKELNKLGWEVVVIDKNNFNVLKYIVEQIYGNIFFK